MPYDPAHIAGTIRRLAKEAGSNRRLAAKAGLDDKTIGNIIRQDSGLTVETAYKIAAAGGISIIELLGEARDTPLDQEAHDLIRQLFELVERAEAATDQLAARQAPPACPPGKRRRA